MHGLETIKRMNEKAVTDHRVNVMHIATVVSKKTGFAYMTLKKVVALVINKLG